MDLASQCRARVVSVLDSLGSRASFQEVRGHTETYWIARVPSTDLEIFVYEDAAGIMEGSRWTILERLDYPDDEHLCESLETRLRHMLAARL